MGEEKHEHREGPIQPDSGGLISPGNGQAMQRAGLALGAALAVVVLGVLFYLGMNYASTDTMHVSGEEESPGTMQTAHPPDSPPPRKAQAPATPGPTDAPGKKPASPQPADATQVPGLDAAYLSSVHQDIRGAWQDTPDRTDLKADAPAYVAFTVHRSGDIRSIWLFKSSGNQDLDALALESIQEVGAFKRFPRTIPQAEVEMLFVFTPESVTMASRDERGKPIYPR